MLLSVAQHEPLFPSVRTARSLYQSIGMQVLRVRTPHQVIRAVDLAVNDCQYPDRSLEWHSVFSPTPVPLLPQ